MFPEDTCGHGPEAAPASPRTRLPPGVRDERATAARRDAWIASGAGAGRAGSPAGRGEGGGGGKRSPCV